MTKRERREFDDRKRLQDAGWDVHKRDAVAFNGGSETVSHLVCKLLAADVLREEWGLRIDSEVAKEGVGEADIVAYAGGGDPFVVEVETALDDETRVRKVGQFVEDEVFRDVLFLDPTKMPQKIGDARLWVREEL